MKHFALDLGGSLIKLVYFSANRPNSTKMPMRWRAGRKKETTKALESRLHFRRFPSSSLRECLDFIERKKLHCSGIGDEHKSEIKATGGGSFKHQQTFSGCAGD